MPVESHNNTGNKSSSSKYDTDKLRALYQDATNIDKKIFAEQKSNVLLYAGEHYAKPGTRFYRGLRNTPTIDNGTKIRVVKNHTQKICKIYVNNILNAAPGVWCAPRQERELAHQKTAELNEACWQYIKQSQNLSEHTANWCNDFVVTGEVITKIFWNQKKGRHLGYEQAVDDQNNLLWEEEPSELNPEGVPLKGRAIFSGCLEYERMFAFNFLRDPRARSINESPIVGYQKLIPLNEAKELVDNDPEKVKKLQVGVTGGDFVVFDSNELRYIETKDQCLLVEWFVRPCDDYPNGYFFLATPQGDILQEMELPFGIWPIVYEGFDELSSTPRHYSIIKVVRPYQSHLNFLASKSVEHAVTLGDDKIITPMGGKIQQGSFLPGIRHVQAQGDYKVLEGRVGDQYVNQMPGVISEMYMAANTVEDSEDKISQLDAYTLLYRSMRDKKKFSKYAEKFERFLIKVCEISLELFRNYADDGELIPAIGRAEMINIAEFRNSEPLHYRIDVLPQTEDIESRLGQQLQINNLMQYAGGTLTKEDLGKLMRNNPYNNAEQMFSDWTLDYDNAVNDILALDRGEYPQPRKYDNHEYQVKMLESRTSKSDFYLLHPFVKELYAKKIQEHNETLAQNARDIQMSQSGFIPADGPLVPVDVYVQDPSSPKKTQRARVPLGALLWLLKKLEQQGVMQQALVQLGQGGQADLARLVPPQNMGNVVASQAAQSGGVTDSPQQPYLYGSGTQNEAP